MIPAGAGRNPNNAADPGWDPTWNGSLPADAMALTDGGICPPYFTWTPTVGVNDDLPMNCMDWYSAQAFCIWDGGRLPTEAEWSYAAAGRAEQRDYPWGSTAPGADANLAAYGCFYNGTGNFVGVSNIAPVGTIPAGNGKWGHADLAGNLAEWTQDYFANPYAQVSCVDCADLTSSAGSNRTARSGVFALQASFLLTSFRDFNAPTDRFNVLGARCARKP
jgi:formylglycine-generating enzyme required for sulfatase activity